MLSSPARPLSTAETSPAQRARVDGLMAALTAGYWRNDTKESEHGKKCSMPRTPETRLYRSDEKQATERGLAAAATEEKTAPGALPSKTGDDGGRPWHQWRRNRSTLDGLDRAWENVWIHEVRDHSRGFRPSARWKHQQEIPQVRALKRSLSSRRRVKTPAPSPPRAMILLTPSPKTAVLLPAKPEE